jgi:hypothetical protein
MALHSLWTGRKYSLGRRRVRFDLDSKVRTTVTQSDPPRDSEPMVIAFHHAGYPRGFPNTVILRLKGCVQLQGGVDATIAMIALQVVTGTVSDEGAFLSTTCTRRNVIRLRDCQKIYAGHGTVLRKPEYWFHVPDPDKPEDKHYRYPICPSFTMWSPEALPWLWARGGGHSRVIYREMSEKYCASTLAAQMSNAVIARDGLCVLSGEVGDLCERAYLIPPSKRA